MAHGDILSASGLTAAEIGGGSLAVHSPIDGSAIAKLKTHGAAEVQAMIAQGVTAFRAWRQVPAPRRGEQPQSAAYNAASGPAARLSPVVPGDILFIT